jgi:hypothetical protein
MNVTSVYEENPLFERKIENATTGLKPACKKILQRISKKNAVIIADYISSVQTEINPSNHYKKAIIMLLCKFSQSNNDKPFEQITRREVIAFLDRLRKPETVILCTNGLALTICMEFTFYVSLNGCTILMLNQTKEQNRLLWIISHN